VEPTSQATAFQQKKAYIRCRAKLFIQRPLLHISISFASGYSHFSRSEDSSVSHLSRRYTADVVGCSPKTGMAMWGRMGMRSSRADVSKGGSVGCDFLLSFSLRKLIVRHLEADQVMIYGCERAVISTEDFTRQTFLMVDGIPSLKGAGVSRSLPSCFILHTFASCIVAIAFDARILSLSCSYLQSNRS
jgi:hypothetical protein